MHKTAADVTALPKGINRQNVVMEDQENPCLLISVGAKRVLTCWKQKNRTKNLKEAAVATNPENGTGSGFNSSSGMLSSVSFQWLSTDMPIKYCSTREIKANTDKEAGTSENVVGSDASYLLPFLENRKKESKSCIEDNFENDWRYLAVTAFLVEVAYSRFDVASLVPLSSPVLALQHVIAPIGLPSEDNVQTGRVYLLISGSTDGNITFWDLTESVESFIWSVSSFQVEKFIDCQKRPRTGRGSQGGRWWKALGVGVSTKSPSNNSITARTIEGTGKNMLHTGECGTPSKISDSSSGSMVCTEPIYTASPTEDRTDDSSSVICKILPLKVLSNVHQSGVNCLHISSTQNTSGSNFGSVYYVLSGGDDQALHCLGFDLQMLPLNQYFVNKDGDNVHEINESESMNNFIHNIHNQNYGVRFLYQEIVTSAHSSAVKGIWTDGCWVFSTGLDQRIRCWLLDENGKLTECACLITSVPEPESLDARACGNVYGGYDVSCRGAYQIVVAGRGMQLVEFTTTCGRGTGDGDSASL
ncbi:hypothetical protein U1Q18_034503 [Sarracenia purpurea var. burkii]